MTFHFIHHLVIQLTSMYINPDASCIFPKLDLHNLLVFYSYSLTLQISLSLCPTIKWTLSLVMDKLLTYFL